jgi:hypothetical protein
MSDYPCWTRRISRLDGKAEVTKARAQARLDRLRALGYDEPTDEERARNQFVNVDMPLHSSGGNP